MKENSCEHDFPSCAFHWLNYWKNICRAEKCDFSARQLFGGQ